MAIDGVQGDKKTLVKIPKNKELTNLYKFRIYRRYNLINYSQPENCTIQNQLLMMLISENGLDMHVIV